ncbi:hypothetical protein [Armatimonas sp.]|uniref:hypothetical protein n=1 Tax=Armatimonas sp. TaxID=1872638 RepID=UPI00286D45DF|nr:hypothetical protein [Armatimonas sp.]
MTIDTALKLAQDSTTDATTLERVVQVLTPGMKQGTELALAIAANPNTHPETLIKLLTLRPGGSAGLVENPATTLYLMEDPQFFEKVPYFVLRRLLNDTNLPAWLVTLLTQHSDATVALAARLHVAVQPEADLGWQREVCSIVEALPLADSGVFPGGDWPLVQLAWQEGKAPQSVGERLASSSRRPLRESTFAADTAGTLGSFRALLQSASGSESLQRVQKKFTLELTKAELIRLALGGSWARQLAARHPAASEELLAILAGDTIEVRERVATNSSASQAVHDGLNAPSTHNYGVHRLPLPPLPDSDDPLYPVVLSVRLRDEPAPLFLARFLGGKAKQREWASLNWLARFASVGRDELPTKTLEGLARDANVFVQAAAKMRLGNPAWRFRFEDVSRSMEA